jgi:hypothetical protein
MNRFDISKFLFYLIFIVGALGLSFAFGLYSGARKTVAYEAVRALKNSVEESLNLVKEEASTLTKTHPKHFLQPARYDGAGVTVNDFADSEEELIFLSGFFNENNELRLIQRDGTVIARWPVSFSEIFPDPSHPMYPHDWSGPKTDWNIDLHGALALPDGSVVFNFEFGGLVKLDRCGKVVWTLAQHSHHSVELAEGGGFWVPGRRYHSEESDSPFPPFQTPLLDDTIMKVSEDGEVLLEISVPELFYKNGLESLLTSNGEVLGGGMRKWPREIVHLNKIAELSSAIADDFPMFKAGDLALSLRKYNLIFIADPNTGKIIWWRIGPWLRQHDPEFIPGGKLIVFNNNIYAAAFSGGQVSSVSVPRVSNIVEIDPVSDEHRVIYGGVSGQEMLSIIRGKHELTRNGGLLVTEFEGGRVFETDATGRIIWEYINRYDSDEVAEITEARIYSADYFNVSNWSCE